MIEHTAEDMDRFKSDMSRIHHGFQSAGPRFGQVWINNKTGREVLIKATDQGADLITFQYLDTKRNCDWYWEPFIKQFTFHRIYP